MQIKMKENYFLPAAVLIIAFIIFLKYPNLFSITPLKDTKIINEINTVGKTFNVSNSTNLNKNNCGIMIDNTNLCVGDEISGELVAQPNTNCLVFINYMNTWFNPINVTTGKDGWYRVKEKIPISGDYKIVAQCDTCITNYQEINSKVCQ